ncbi:uncharacterized protein LOC120140421 isoform X2 [Hibiscus syriacus]|uniref:uncharacterized protein LOC120140421 isoform X2 n=1 Tax=Hibiscus syriacus TaxID=106335 RepID=UPI0019211AE4|nr:uncharacterized protein LOC120140421 isoform X2 [Hibiscus syriacus]
MLTIVHIKDNSNSLKLIASHFRALLSLMVVLMELTILDPKQGGMEVEVMELPLKKAKKLTQPQVKQATWFLGDFTTRVDTMQTLHNLNEDELTGFEESWNGKAQKHLPGWSGSFIGQDTIGANNSGQNRQAGQREDGHFPLLSILSQKGG